MAYKNNTKKINQFLSDADHKIDPTQAMVAKL